MYDYLNNRYQRVKIGSVRSHTQNIQVGVPKGSVVGPIPFNIFINDLLFFDLGSEICKFANNNTIFACENDLNKIVMYLEDDLCELLGWFPCNFWKMAWAWLSFNFSSEICNYLCRQNLAITGVVQKNSKWGGGVLTLATLYFTSIPFTWAEMAPEKFRRDVRFRWQMILTKCAETLFTLERIQEYGSLSDP